MGPLSLAARWRTSFSLTAAATRYTRGMDVHAATVGAVTDLFLLSCLDGIAFVASGFSEMAVMWGEVSRQHAVAMMTYLPAPPRRPWVDVRVVNPPDTSHIFIDDMQQYTYPCAQHPMLSATPYAYIL